VCGDKREFNLPIPGFFDAVVPTSVVIEGVHIPPGYVCTYTIKID